MEFYEILLPLAMILILSKLLSIVCRKIGIPQVIGMLLTGVILGLINYIPNQQILNGEVMDGIKFIAEIGVILIMFSAGIETDLKQIKSTGPTAMVVTLLGIVAPLGLGFLVSGLFNGFDNPLMNVFYGVILTATSVSVTIACLKELGKLQSKVGTIIVSAAIIDDIIGIVILSLVISLNTNQGHGMGDIAFVLLKIVVFFVLALALGFGMKRVINWIDDHYDHHRRIPIIAFAFCFFFAYAAEKWFGIADITGAYVAGIIFAGKKDTNYINRKVDVTSYMLFTPVFFAKIGMSIKFEGMNLAIVGFGLCFVLAGILGKLLGCGLALKMCKYNLLDSIRVGLGMMCRAEVCLICAQKGVDNGLISDTIMPFILILIILTSLATPLFIKLTYRHEEKLQIS